MPGLLGLIPGDFAYDGQLDAVVMSAHPHCPELVSLSMCNRSFSCTPLPAATDQVTAVDVDGGLSSALLGGYANATDATGGPGCAKLNEECDASGKPGCCACGLACTRPEAGASSQCLPATTRAMAWVRSRSSPGPFELAQPFGGFEPRAITTDDGTSDYTAGEVLGVALGVGAVEGVSAVERVGVAEGVGVAERVVGVAVGASSSVGAAEARATLGTPELNRLGSRASGSRRAPATRSAQTEERRMREARPGLAGGAAGGASVLGESIALEESVAPVIPASPNANAQVDLDGDCVADLVLQAPPHGSTSCEAAACRLLVWLQKPEPGSPRWSVAPDLNESLPVGAGQLGLADMDSDGAMDLVFTSTDTQAHLWLHIWYAVLGASGWDPQVSSALSECGFKPTPPASLCTRRPYLTFFKRQWGMPAGWVMAQTGDRPPTLSLADFDLNSFPDALMPLHAPADAPAPCEPDAPCVLLLYNDERMRCAGLPAAGGSGGEESISRLRLYTESTSSSYPPPADERLFAMLAGASGAAFFDVYDDGVWDVIAMHPHGAVSVWHRASAGGSYFLRATTTDGACAPDALAGVPGESNGWPDEDARDGRSGQCVARGDGGGAFGAWASKPLLHQASRSSPTHLYFWTGTPSMLPPPP